MEAVNNGSLVVKITYGATRVLLPGDITAAAEEALLGTALAGRCEVLFVPHHGSRASSSAAFLAHVAPRVAVASCGHGNVFGLPHPEVLARYAAASAALYRTDRDGAVRVVSDGRYLRVETFRDASSMPWPFRPEPDAAPAAD